MNTMTQIKPTIWYAGKQLQYTDTITEPQEDAQDAMGNYIDEMQEELDKYKDRGILACWIHDPNDVHHLYTEIVRAANELPIWQDKVGAFYVDFRLKEIRSKKNPHNAIPFAELTDETKAQIRGIRSAVGACEYIEGLDDESQDDAEHYVCWHCGYTGCDCQEGLDD